MNLYKDCTICPRNCHVNRYINKGFCGLSNKVKLSLAKPFFYEEPPISGTKGSGTIFFTGCNLRCVYCQNIEISKYMKGKDVSNKRLSEIMIELQDCGVHNINLVTPTMFVPSIIKAIRLARKKGLKIPIIYNTSGYENYETIKILNGYIDIYLTDFKYFDNYYASKYSKCPNYLEYAKTSLSLMTKQTGPCIFDNNGIMQKGVIVRHLMLPNLINDSKKILKYLYQTYHDDIFISIMNQYTPNKEVSKDLCETIKENDYNNLIDYACELGISNAFCQIDGTQSESFIPDFNFDGRTK
mgnify:CR=1 FL=1